MVKQDQRDCIVPDSPLPMDDKASIDLGALAVSDVELKEQSVNGDDFAPKVRKPYTITKQRERWTQEEHKKFLEALKLYGRAWRRIEEHVGTKTAVQIRSHAQKFFSKVVRESNTSEGPSAKPIEIPPPRPKRKPMHPYPRKLVSPLKTGILIPEKPASPNMLGQENRSPTTVLSAVGSDSSGGPDSCMPNGCPSSVSSALALNTGNIFGSEEPKLVSDQDGMSSRAVHEDENSSTDEEIPMDTDVLSQNTAFVEGDTNKSAKQSLKLFGKTFLVVDPCEQSCSTQGTCSPESVDKDCSFPLRVVPLKLPMSSSEDVRNAFSDRLPMLVYTTPKNKSEIACSQAPFLWLTLRCNALDSESTPEVLSPTPIKAQSMYAKNEMLDNDEHKEGSCTGSNTDFVGGKNGDIDSLPRLSLERKGKVKELFSSYKLSKRISANSLNCRRGFVPYKRCFTEQDSTVSSTDTGKERETRRIRLCL